MTVEEEKEMMKRIGKRLKEMEKTGNRLRKELKKKEKELER